MGGEGPRGLTEGTAARPRRCRAARRDMSSRQMRQSAPGVLVHLCIGHGATQVTMLFTERWVFKWQQTHSSLARTDSWQNRASAPPTVQLLKITLKS